MDIVADVVNLALIVAAVLAVSFGRRLFTRGGKYYTPARARAFWIIWVIAVVVVLTLLAVGLVNRYS